MKYLIFATEAAAEKAQMVILKLWSHELAQKGYGRDKDYVVNTGIKDGQQVLVTTERWSSVEEVKTGWAIASPEGYKFADQKAFRLEMAAEFSASDMAKIGIPDRGKPIEDTFIKSDVLDKVELPETPTRVVKVLNTIGRVLGLRSSS